MASRVRRHCLRTRYVGRCQQHPTTEQQSFPEHRLPLTNVRRADTVTPGLDASPHPREPQVPNAPRLDHETGDAPLRVTLHIDHAAAADESVLVGGLEH